MKIQKKRKNYWPRVRARGNSDCKKNTIRNYYKEKEKRIEKNKLINKIKKPTDRR